MRQCSAQQESTNCTALHKLRLTVVSAPAEYFELNCIPSFCSTPHAVIKYARKTLSASGSANAFVVLTTWAMAKQGDETNACMHAARISARRKESEGLASAASLLSVMERSLMKPSFMGVGSSCLIKVMTPTLQLGAPMRCEGAGRYSGIVKAWSALFFLGKRPYLGRGVAWFWLLGCWGAGMRRIGFINGVGCGIRMLGGGDDCFGSGCLCSRLNYISRRSGFPTRNVR